MKNNPQATTEPGEVPGTVSNDGIAVHPGPLIPDKQMLQQTLMDSLDVMKLLHICRGTLYNWRKQGLIAASKVGGRVYFETADVHRMIRERKQPKWNSAA
jgi:hypothetical protein